MHIEQKITSLIEPALQSLNCELVRVKQIGQDVIQVMIDTETGANIDDCTKATHLINNILQVAELSDHYSLEVSSPGLDRPLIKPEHFAKFIGHTIKLNTQTLVDGQKRFLGKLTAFDNDNNIITLAFEDKVVLISLDQVQSANLHYMFNDNKKLKKG
jgi:ribosome maturation factor RimP